MRRENREVIFDEELKIEAYRFSGIMQKFPNHFHEDYVIGFVESGSRWLTCKNKEYTIGAGDVVLLNPLENHSCRQVDSGLLDWRSINIGEAVMRAAVKEITGDDFQPVFSATVVYRNEGLVLTLKELHQLIMSKHKGFDKDELFYFLLENLISNYTAPDPVNTSLQRPSDEIQVACAYMESHYTKCISLNELCGITGLNKYTLLRHFVRQRGITPYQYLETIRVNNSKRLLESGGNPADVAILCGFNDQSHFNRFFKNYIGLTPKQYQEIFVQRRTEK